MTGAILFEQQHRGDVWRLEVVTFNGRTFANWRKWWREGETLKPSRDGVTIPLERIGELHGALSGLGRHRTRLAGRKTAPRA